VSDLDSYRAKRNFDRTPEPAGSRARRTTSGTGLFVIHKHAARRLHYDLRLEHGGVLWSWAVTRGPSLDPADKRLAVHVEDHPLDYADFEGNIPKGEYGGGSVIVWDQGRWTAEGDAAAGMAKGHIAFTLAGQKLSGLWHLVRLPQRRGEKKDNWLLIKADDDAAREDVNILEADPRSVATGRTIEEVAADVAPPPGKTSARKTTDTKIKTVNTTAANTKTVKSPKRPAGARAKAVPDRDVASASEAAAIKTGRKTRATTREPDTPAPQFTQPCLATLQDKPPEGDDWLHEVKFDGYRMQALKAGARVQLLTRTGLDWTDRFGPDVVSAITAINAQSLALDGEIVVEDESGRSSFGALQAVLAGERTGRLLYYVFDLLHLDGDDLRGDPLRERKRKLETLIGSEHDGTVRYSEHFDEPGQVMLQHACRLGLEGVISKRGSAAYRSGRGGDWVKSKCTKRQEFVIVGYVPSKRFTRSLGSIVVGVHDKGTLKLAGRVGTGFTAASADRLLRTLDQLRVDAPPVPDVRDKAVVWVKPELVAEIAFAEWTPGGSLRHAVFHGLREDKPAEDVEADHTTDTPTAPSPAGGTNSGKPAPPADPPVPGLTKPDKLLWPAAGVSKRRLLEHYEQVWPRMEKHIVNRPLSLLRAPDGVDGQTFFQKNAMPGMPEALIVQKDPDGSGDLLSIDSFEGLTALVQLGVVEIHIWGSTLDHIEQPDQVVFDLDPDPTVDAERVRDAALLVRDRLDAAGFASFVKISGGKGFHVIAPLKPEADWAAVKTFAHTFAKTLAADHPDAYTATLSKKARVGKIFVDYLRNGRGSTTIAPYSTRRNPRATVSVPVTWAALRAGIAPDFVTAHSTELADALKAADPWVSFAKRGIPLPDPA
jgi:bifunctional non-homologous end joining protein LigD